MPGRAWASAASVVAHELRNARDRDRDVVLDVQAFHGLGDRQVLADLPQRLGLRQAFGDHAVGDAALLHAGFEQALELRTRMFLGLVVRHLEQHAPGRGLVQRHLGCRHVARHQRQGELAHDLETGQAGAQRLVRQAEQGHGMFHRRHRRPGRELRGRQRHQLHGRRGDDAQRAFGADQQVAQVVAGVVLAQAADRPFQTCALRRDHLQAQAQVAGIAVAHHLGAAGIGAQVAADGATAFGRQAQREQEAGVRGRLPAGSAACSRPGP